MQEDRWNSTEKERQVEEAKETMNADIEIESQVFFFVARKKPNLPSLDEWIQVSASSEGTTRDEEDHEEEEKQ